MNATRLISHLFTLALTGPLFSASYTWDGGTGDWTDSNWNSGSATSPDSITSSGRSRNYVGDDFTIDDPGSDVTSSQRITLVDGSLSVTDSTLDITVPGGNLSTLNLGHSGGIAATATFTNSTINMTPHNNAGRAIQVRNGSTLIIDNTTVNLTGGNNPSIELRDNGSTALITNNSVVNSRWIRTDNNSQITFESGTITLSAPNPLRSANAFNSDINWSSSLGLGSTIVHTDLTSNDQNLAGKTAQGYFGIDGTQIDPAILNTEDWTLQANIDTLNAQLEAQAVNGTHFFLDNSVAGQQTLTLIPEPSTSLLGGLALLGLLRRRR